MIYVNEGSNIPIYQQICDEFVKLIIKNVLGEGEQLPSVRELAMQLQMNPNTIQKAYKCLESEGYVVPRQGKGSYVIDYDKAKGIYLSHVNTQMKSILKDYLMVEDNKTKIINHIEHLLEEM